MFHKVRSVYCEPDYVLLVHFSDGTVKRYDIKPLFDKIPVFESLRSTPGLFQQVVVDPGGYGISWTDMIDLDCEELWVNGVPASSPFVGLLAFSDATALWGLHESTLRKAIQYGKLKDGLDALKFGKQWVVTKDSMLREYGPPNTSAAE